MINNQLLKTILNIQLPVEFSFSQLGLSNCQLPNSLSFLDDIKYKDQLNQNDNIKGVLVEANHSHFIDSSKVAIIVDDPKWIYFMIYNYLAKKNKVSIPSVIDQSTIIHPTAFVADHNVRIGKNCLIYPNVSILENVEIGDHCIIQSGTVIGSEGFEYKRTGHGILSVFHDGEVIIGNRVEIGANTCIDKGFSHKHTVIEEDAKIDNLIHVAHGVHIKSGAFIIAGTILGGSSVISENAWMGINSSIAPGLTVKANGFVSMGAVVTKDVNENEQVTGNFAIEHKKFLSIFKKTLNIEK